MLKYAKYIFLLIAIVILNSTCEKVDKSRIVIIETKEAKDVDASSANLTATLIDVGENGISQYGFCWATSPEPTVENSYTDIGSTDNKGDYYDVLRGLNPETLYYVRAYAFDGENYVYGESLEITSDALSFTIESPFEGGIYGLGYNYTISWEANISDNINIELYKGNTFIKAIAENIENNGTFSWNIENTFEEGNNYKVKIASFENATIFKETGLFTIMEDAPPTVTTTNVTNISYQTATSGGNVTNAGSGTVTARGVCWSTTQMPTISNPHTTDGSGLGSFTSNITGLTKNTTYYVRAYATNTIGTSYGEQKTFITLQELLPTVTTTNVTNISYQTARSGGNVTNSGSETVTARGVCWSTTQTPTISNPHTTNGSGIGSFTSNITGLTENTTYYVRAYATNSIGTSYGEQKTFTTQGLAPTVTTTNVTNISHQTATSGGNVTNAGSATVTARGVCWSTTQTPTISNPHTTNGSGVGSFTSNITGLTHNTTYYVRAYATNSIGTSYGEQKTFTTLQAPVFSGALVYVEGGSFQMGCGTGAGTCNSWELPVHTVTLDNFNISKYEITNQQYADFLNAYGSSTVLSGEYAGQIMIEASSGTYDWGLHNNSGTWAPVAGYENSPVILVSWYGANEFCQYYGCRLPTEAEWEYAARGGVNYTDYYMYSGSNAVYDVAWYQNNSSNHTHQVGTKATNQLGIFDMSGNVWEWCSDWYGDYTSGSQINPTGPTTGSYRVYRGGSWGDNADFCRSAIRNNFTPGTHSNVLGFRLVRSY